MTQVFPEPPRRRPKIKISAQALAMNPSSQPYQPGELPPVPPAFPGDAAAASLTAEQVQALRNRNYLRADSYTRADSYGRQDSGLSFYEYQIGDGDESPGSLSTATGYLSPRTPITLPSLALISVVGALASFQTLPSSAG